MTNQTFRRIWPAVIVAGSFGTLVSSSPLASAQDSATQAAASGQDGQAGQRTDGQIEMDVVHSLDSAPELKQDWITAGTVQGEVTLSGTAASDQNRQLAESLADKVSGVTKVVNNLKVGDPTAAQSDGSSDQGQDPGQYADPSQQQAANTNPNGGPNNQAGNQGGYPQQPSYAPQQNFPQQPNYPQQPANQPGYEQPGYRPGSRTGYQPQGNYPRQPEQPHGPVTLAQGTLLKVRSSEPLDSKRAKVGSPVEFTVVRDVYAAGVLAIPRGATVHGHVVEAKNSGALGGKPELGLKLESLDLAGHDYDLDTAPLEVKGPNKAGRTAGNAFGGALLGAIIGGAVGGGEGAAIGAGAGAVGGTAATAATPGPRVWIPSEALMDFHLNTPVTVNPVSMEEAQRLAANAPPPSQRPTLYRRGPYPYGYYPPPPPPGYYRPY